MDTPENASFKDDLATLVKKNTEVLGGQTSVVGLNLDQTHSLIEYMEKNELKIQMGIPLTRDDLEKRKLDVNSCHVIFLGSTVNSHVPLFESLDIDQESGGNSK